MNKMFVLIALALASCGVSAKTCYLNVDTIVSNLPISDSKIEAKVNAEFANELLAIAKLESDIKSESDKLAKQLNIAPEDEIASARKRINGLRDVLLSQQSDLQKVSTAFIRKEQQTAFETMDAAIDLVMEQQSCDVVINMSAVVRPNNASDITSAVFKSLKL
jgi:Skp family chaperone for outer membrane proteins